MIYPFSKLIKTQIDLVKHVDDLEHKVKVLTDRLEALIKWQGKAPTKSYREY